MLRAPSQSFGCLAVQYSAQAHTPHVVQGQQPSRVFNSHNAHAARPTDGLRYILSAGGDGARCDAALVQWCVSGRAVLILAFA